MEKIITFNSLRNYAYCNERICKRPIRGIVISFFGLRASQMYDEDTDDADNVWCERGGMKVMYSDVVKEVHDND